MLKYIYVEIYILTPQKSCAVSVSLNIILPWESYILMILASSLRPFNQCIGLVDSHLGFYKHFPTHIQGCNECITDPSFSSA